jgi:ABC-type amino acid transport substrate-binding protein
MQSSTLKSSVTVHNSLPQPLPLSADMNRLDQIRKRGILRICYSKENNMPFSYFNNKNQLVGLDIELLQLLENDFEIQLEFIPANGDNLSSYFRDGYCDMGISQKVTPKLSLVQNYAISHMDYTLAFLVKDHKRHQFNDLDALRNESLIIAVSDGHYYQQQIHKLLPKAELLIIDSYSDYIKQYGDKADALLTVAEKGSAWSLLYPEYAVATPFADTIKIPIAFPIPKEEQALADFLKVWITLKQKDGTVNRLFDYWILGHQLEEHEKRWSVIRNVLHWVQ